MLVVPLLLYKRTRTIALIASLIFHLFNSVTLQIGIFPFFALSFVVFFYPPEKIRKLFFRNKYASADRGKISYEYKNILIWFFIPYFIIQLLLPVRHYFIKGDVLWTEEGHRLSWRMMLRTRYGDTDFKIIDKKTGKELFYNFRHELTHKQKGSMETKPDMIWQMAQRLKKYYAQQGRDVAVYADTRVSINGGRYRTLINPETDLTTAEWNYFFHSDWVLLYDNEGNIIE